MIMDRLMDAVRVRENPSVLGLDTRLEYLPTEFARYFDTSAPEGATEAVLAYNRGLVDGLHDLLPAVKVQVAYYEMYGVPGMKAYRETCRYAAEKGMLVIADVKRGDIGATSEAYALAHLGETPLGGARMNAFEADFATVNPYLGSDGVKPFLDVCRERDKGVFLLVKTSNPSSSEIQDQVLKDGRTVYESVADLVSEWGRDMIGEGGYSAAGAVVGATHPEEGRALRARIPHVFFLLPGYGAQGASGKDLEGMFDAKGQGAVVNASRSLLCAWKKMNTGDFAGAAREEALRMRADIRGALREAGKVY